MFLSILNVVDTWWCQMKSLTIHHYRHLTPQEYVVMLVICVAAGLFLLRGKR